MSQRWRITLMLIMVAVMFALCGHRLASAADARSRHPRPVPHQRAPVRPHRDFRSHRHYRPHPVLCRYWVQGYRRSSRWDPEGFWVPGHFVLLPCRIR